MSDFWTIYRQYDTDYHDMVKRIKEICKKIEPKEIFNKANNLNKQILEAQKGGTEDDLFLVEKAQKYFE